MHIVVAPDKFKGTLTARQVADRIAAGIRVEAPHVAVVRVPVADGGDGTLIAFADAGFELVPVTVEGPTGEVVPTAYARGGDVAVVELADASGLARLSAGLSPLDSSTIGTGQVLAAAVAAGCRDLVLGVGGSASTDGGLGLLVGLGATVALDGSTESLDISRVTRLLDGVRVTLAADVDNPLLGPDGAAAVYGPQKGADADQVRLLDDRLARWADLVAATTGADHRDDPGAGAAGGAGFAALAVLGAERRSGVEVVLDLVGFDQALVGADLVVTGEGSLDAQSLRGKAPMGVVRRARAAGVPVVAVCGRTSLSVAELAAAGLTATWALTDLEPDVTRCITDAARLLEEVGVLVATKVG